MRTRVGLLALGCSLVFACGERKPGGGDDTGDDEPTGIATLEVGLSQSQIHWVDGATTDAPTLTATLVKADGTRQDVTDRVTWEVTPPTMGAVSGNTLSATGTDAGPGNLTAAFNSLEGAAQFEVFVEDVLDGNAAAGTKDLFDAATPDTSATLTMAYPPNGALVPPNLGEMEVHWRDGSGQDVYEVTLTGGYVTLKTYVNATGAATYNVLPRDQWTRLSQGSDGVDLDIRVRGLKAAAPATYIEGSEAIRIASEDLKGGVYYWNTSGGSSIFRYDMLKPEVPAEKFALAGETRCVGCHTVSRSGNVVAYRQEGGSMNMGNAIDVAAQTRYLTTDTQNWNFATIHPNDKDMIVTRSDGMYVTDLTNQSRAQIAGSASERYSHPEFSVDGKTIVATRLFAGDEVYATRSKLVKFAYDEATKTVGAPVDFVTPAAGQPETYTWYPSYSPDDQWIIYNQTAVGAGRDTYDEATAEMWIKKADGTGDAIHLSQAEVPNTYNSWPKFTPFVSMEPLAGGGFEKVMWFTVASRRGFGIRSNNNNQAPQLWLAPFYPERAARNEPATGSAVRLPFQNLAQGNHIAQWTEQIVTIN